MNKHKLDSIPKSPGCYIFKNKHAEIIYIGKSKYLYNRVRQYFTGTDSAKHHKYAKLAKEVWEIKTIVTNTETDALLLECRLIKEHQPKYNSQLKRANTFPFIRIEAESTYPTISITEEIKEDGCHYFGCFYNRDDAFNVIELISRIWQTPSCCKGSFMGRPCLNHHLGKCCAPCGSGIDPETYNEKIKAIIKCLNGNFTATLKRLNTEMKTASASLDFEIAARIRDHILGLDKLKKKQRRLFSDLNGKEVYLFFKAANEPCFSLFYIRNGIALNRTDFNNLQVLDAKQVEAFVIENMVGSSIVEYGESLTACLMAVYADKYFVSITKNTTIPQIIRKLHSAYNEFIK